MAFDKVKARLADSVIEPIKPIATIAVFALILSCVALAIGIASVVRHAS